VIRRLVASGTVGDGPSAAPELRSRQDAEDREWTFAKAFLYSLTLLTTIGKSNNTEYYPLKHIIDIDNDKEKVFS
jgi:hypothetical protein